MTTVRLRDSGKRVWTDLVVTVDQGTLIENGWHHEDECPAKKLRMPPSMLGAIESLHRQAHWQERPDPLACRLEPCRSLSFEQLRGVS